MGQDNADSTHCYPVLSKLDIRVSGGVYSKNVGISSIVDSAKRNHVFFG